MYFETYIHFRYAVNAKNYDLLEGCQNVATLTSTLKLFLREMTAPLINKEMVNNIKISNVSLTGKGDQGTLILQLKKSLGVIDKLSYRVLHYILLHAKHVADNKGAKHKLCTEYMLAFLQSKKKLDF